MTDPPKNPEPSRIAMVFRAFTPPTEAESEDSFGHPSHRGFAESIDADTIVIPSTSVGPLAGTVIEDIVTNFRFESNTYDVYIIANPSALYAAPLIHRYNQHSKLLYLAADWRVYGLKSYNLEALTFPKSGIKRVDRRIDHVLLRNLLNRYIDGVFAVSELMEEHFRSNLSLRMPIEVTHPYIQPERFEEFNQIQPNLSSNVAITICEARDHKGTDLLADTWSEVRDSHPNAELHIIGRGHQQALERSGVQVHGFVDSITEYLSKASLYVQPARFDAFPVTVLEAMRAGIPPLVTTTTGSRSEVQHIDDSLIVEPKPEALAAGINEYFSHDDSYRERLSRTARSRSEKFDAATRKEAFRDAFQSLVDQIP